MIAFIPFVDPFYGAWDWWYLLFLPLALLIALVYKAMRCEDLTDVPRQTVMASAKLVGAFVACAVALWILVIVLERCG